MARTRMLVSSARELQSARGAQVRVPVKGRKARRREKPGYARTRCPHLRKVWTSAPHPRYGADQPHYIEHVVRDPSCGCR